ncbi:tubulin/FtsZ family protein [Halobacterium jilantaiense]|uniref:Tubulin-like protein CetZ n=1 Tax=Halobacterium jilantaiense TaxID=355548 RepID=A0A1I0QJH8_9EURY|nr:tubulin/FtsZ family protein [Halobacterium jilantaiense]SEW26828.1 Cell division GTPase FtsZ [Halobacterium jilantaiense]
MKLAVVGFGNAGGKIADRIVEYETQTERSLCQFTAVVNSARIDLHKLGYVPQRHQILVGQTDERSKGHGAGADPDLGAELTRQDLAEVQRVLDNVPLHDVDAFLVVAGLGGGTGSGGGPVFAEALGERYGEPVYGLGVLPSGDEGGRASLNAARSIRSFVDSTDATIAFDNDAWREGTQSIESGYEQTNVEIAKRVVSLLAPGEYDGSPVSENAMDSSDVKRTLSVGGVATVAYAEASLEEETQRQRGLLGRLRNDGEAGEREGAATKVHGLVRRAARSRLTCPADITSAERALVVVSGPPAELSQKGLVRSRKWLESQIDSVEVLAGDDPRPGADRLRATVLLANATDVPRIDALQEQAVDAQENIDAQAAERDTAISELVTDPDDELEPI